MKAAYVYDAEDTQGPWVLLCEQCILANYPNGTPEPGWAHDEDDPFWRCACCGTSPADDE